MAAVLVAHDAQAWLPAVLQGLADQDHPALDVVVVDNASTDGTPGLLAQAAPAERVLTLRRNVGYGSAVDAARRHEVVANADFLLLVHDDLVLAPQAVSALAAALAADDQLGMVGPKLREWAPGDQLQAVGMAVDRLGRPESGIEPGEIDQGQHDGERDVLYVPSAGMLVRTETLGELWGFDPRFPAMGDDLDLCWRAWLAGWRVAVVTDAVGHHAAAGSRGRRRLWRGRAGQSRYLAERHALTTVLQSYRLRRLLWVVPLSVALGLAQVIGLALARRWGEAGATPRAYAWNLGQVRTTLRRRRAVQRARRRSDAELAHLFAPGLPRLAAASDTLREWLAARDAPALHADTEPAAPGAAPEGRRVTRVARERPALVAGLLLALVYLVGVVPLLGPGQLVGGSVLPWPDDPTAFLDTYASAIAGEPLATKVSASPITAVLGALGWVSLGSAWAAQRLAVLGLLPVAWLTALRAGRLVTARPGPRALGATLYALSPPVLATLAQGRFGEMVVAALLPAIVLLTVRAASSRSPSEQAWRAVGWLGLAAALALAAAPGLWVVIVPIMGLGAIAALPRPGHGGGPLLRMAVAAVGTAALLAPWLWDLATREAVHDPAPAAGLPAWRALTLTPGALPGMDGVHGYLAAGLCMVVVALALAVGLRARPVAVAGLVAGLASAGGAAWIAARLDVSWVWAPALLLPGAVALAGLGVVAARGLRPALRAWRAAPARLLAVAGAVGVVAGLGGAAWMVSSGPWDGLDRQVQLTPLFVGADVEHTGPYRVLLVDAQDEQVRWAVTGARGPDMREHGTARSPQLTAAVDGALSGVLAGDLDGGRALGLAGLRYVVVRDASPLVREALARQPALEPLAAGGGRVFRVRSWIPRAALLPPQVAAALLDDPPVDLQAHEEQGLARTGHARFTGTAGDQERALVLNEETGGWRATADGAPLDVVGRTGGLTVFGTVPAGAQVVVEPRGDGVRAVVLSAQALVLLGLLSLMLRPPRAGHRGARQSTVVPSGPARDRRSGPAAGLDVPGGHREAGVGPPEPVDAGDGGRRAGP